MVKLVLILLTLCRRYNRISLLVIILKLIGFWFTILLSFFSFLSVVYNSPLHCLLFMKFPFCKMTLLMLQKKKNLFYSKLLLWRNDLFSDIMMSSC